MLMIVYKESLNLDLELRGGYKLLLQIYSEHSIKNPYKNTIMVYISFFKSPSREKKV